MTGKSMMKITASLRITAIDLDPLMVSRVLGVDPSYSHRRGDAHEGRAGRRYAPLAEGMWSLQSPVPDDEPIDAHIMSILAMVETSKLAVIQAHGHRVDIFVGVFLDDFEPVGLRLAGNTLERLGEIGATVDIAIYPAIAPSDTELVTQPV